MQTAKLTANTQDPTDATVAVESRGLQYGVASGTSVPSPILVPASVPGLNVRLRFLASELLGLVFVLGLTLYILAVPTSLSRPALVRAVLSRGAKRTLDILGASFGLVFTAPLWLLIALIIKFDSVGPVFYTQARIAANRRTHERRCFRRTATVECRQDERRRTDYLGIPFKVIKFRTMTHEAEKHSGPVWAGKGDPRVTRVGAFLRKAHLDEMPQFLNVLKGDMALVGPRPERPTFVAELSVKVDGYTRRLRVKPGITGLAQIENGYDDSIDSVVRKVRYDLRYIDTQSIWSDIKILARTVMVVITPERRLCLRRKQPAE